MEQTPFVTTENPFAQNPEPRCGCVLLLDVSGSMQGQAIKELEDGLTLYRDELASDSLARKRVEVAVITFGGEVRVVQPFTSADQMQSISLTATGDTPMGQAVVTGLKLLEDRKREYKANAIMYYRPWVFLITDGGPTDVNKPEWPEAISLIKQGEEKKSFSFFSVGVEGADFDRLKELSAREPLKLKGLRFRDLFKWLSASQNSVSRSQPGDVVPLANPTTPNGWASV